MNEQINTWSSDAKIIRDGQKYRQTLEAKKSISFSALGGLELSVLWSQKPSACSPSYAGDYVTYYPSYRLLCTSILPSRAAISSHCIFV